MNVIKINWREFLVRRVLYEEYIALIGVFAKKVP